jgi:hypothetical protein
VGVDRRAHGLVEPFAVMFVDPPLDLAQRRSRKSRDVDARLTVLVDVDARLIVSVASSPAPARSPSAACYCDVPPGREDPR